MKISRREFMKGALITGAALSLPLKFGVKSVHALANSPFLAKWIQPIRGLTLLGDPNGIPVATGVADPSFANTTYYQITAGEFFDQLHPGLGPTRLWGYWDTTNPVKRHLGGLIVASSTLPGSGGKATRIRFTNALNHTAEGGTLTQHIIPVDTSIAGANQAQNRIAIHLHGGLVPWISDGGPFDWWSPSGVHALSYLNGPTSVFDNISGHPMLPGQTDYYYPNGQSTRLLWYHDHAHGITRTNAYAGLATGYLILDAINDTYVAQGKIPGLGSTVPLVFQDKTFVNEGTQLVDPSWATVARSDVQSQGSLWYAHVYDPNRYRLLVSSKYQTPPSPSAIPEFFADTMLCNGTVYPLLTVEAKRYRFFILNACNARFLNLNLLQADPGNPDGINLNPGTLFPTNPAGPDMIQIGNEGGFLVTEATYSSPHPFNPTTMTWNLLLAPAERADIIIDFTGLAGNEYILYNDASGPFPGGDPTNDYFLGNPLNPIQPAPGTGPDTRQILRIKVVSAQTADPQPPGNILNPTLIDPPLLVTPGQVGAPLPIPAGIFVRDLTLNEDFDQYGRLRQLLGTTKLGLVSKGFGLEYLAQPTENVSAGSTEVWRIFNLTADTHPIHFHLVNVQVLQRQLFQVIRGRFTPTGQARGPEANEIGWKETVQMHPGEATTVVMKFDLPTGLPFPVAPSPRTGGNEFVWHCHILEHEEHDMMRPLVVT